MRATGTSGLQEHQGYRNIRATGTSGLQEHQGYRNIRATGAWGGKGGTAVPPLYRPNESNAFNREP